MKNFDKTVPFDPGYSQMSFSFVGNIDFAIDEYKKLKAPNQKKFWLMKNESLLVDFINKSTAFYLGCLLWGAFLHYRFKDSPKEIEGNHSLKLSAEEQKELNCCEEVNAILDYVNSLHRDCKYFLKRPAKIDNFILKILENYIEFAQLNENFVNTKTTDDIKLPKDLAHFDKLSNGQLDSLCEKIYSIIESKQIVSLLDLKFYEI